MDVVADQAPAGVCFAWGLPGADALSARSACVVVVDVLSFSSAVCLAVSRGTTVFPYPWDDRTAAAFAHRNGAELAVSRHEVSSDHPWSLSLVSMQEEPLPERLVLPSPNGSAIAATANALVVTACLRNGGAVARWLRDQRFGTGDQPVAVIAAGERWPHGELRPALEDELGAGAVIDALRAHGCDLSPEAAAAADAFRGCNDVPEAVAASASGRELSLAGYAGDVALASEIDVDAVVPRLEDRAFTSAARSSGSVHET